MIPIDFIHIPKNCGTSIKRLVANNILQNFQVYDHGYDPLLLDPEKSMFILRDPIDRFVSAFYYSELYPNCSLMQARDRIKNPSDLVQALMNDKNNESLISSKFHTIGKKILGISWVWTPQYYWDNGAKYVLFHENINQDFKDFLEKTGRDTIELPFLNKSNRINHEFTNEELEYLYNRFQKDYEIIDKYKKYDWK